MPAFTKSGETPDETRTPDKTRVEMVDLGGGAEAVRFAIQPGWRWSECIRPVVGTETCQARHVGAVVSGRRHPHALSTAPSWTSARRHVFDRARP